MGWSTKSRAVCHPTSYSPSCPAAPRRSPLPAWHGSADRSARPGIVVLLLYPSQERSDTLFSQPCTLLSGVHVLLVHHRGVSPRGCEPCPARGGNCGRHSHPSSSCPHQERTRHCTAKSRIHPQHGNLLQPSGRHSLLPQWRKAGCDQDINQPGGIVGADGSGTKGKQPKELVCCVQGGAAPEGRTLSDLWHLCAASRPPLCLVGSIKMPLAQPVITVLPSLSHISNTTLSYH